MAMVSHQASLDHRPEHIDHSCQLCTAISAAYIPLSAFEKKPVAGLFSARIDAFGSTSICRSQPTEPVGCKAAVSEQILHPFSSVLSGWEPDLTVPAPLKLPNLSDPHRAGLG